MSEHLWADMKKEYLYYGVLTHQEYLSCSDIRESQFFVSGQEHINGVLDGIDNYFRPINFFGKALDFGCGVGRLVIPLTKRFQHVIGVDVSKSMIEEASLLCKDLSVQFEESLDLIEKESCDFVHSYIVFQHIPPKKGLQILSALIARLKPGGCGMVHVTFRALFSPIKRCGLLLRRHSSMFHGACNLLQSRKWNHPCIPMYVYDFSSVFQVFYENRIYEIHARFEQHGAYRGACLFFRKNHIE